MGGCDGGTACAAACVGWYALDDVGLLSSALGFRPPMRRMTRSDEEDDREGTDAAAAAPLPPA